MSALIWCPFPDREVARAVVEQLLDEELVACANLVDGVESLFVWQGQHDQASECGALFKTQEALLEKATTRLSELHPYETPAIMGWPCPIAPEQTRIWLAKTLGK